MLRSIGRVLGIVAGLVLAASFAGEVHQLGDSLAVFRPVILVGCLCAGALVWRWRGARVLMLATVAIGLWQGAGLAFYAAPQDGPDIRLYQKNMLFRLRDHTGLAADVRSAAADVVTLQEVSYSNRSMLAALRDLYPYHLLCVSQSAGAVAILSRTPLTQTHCGEVPGVARAVTRINGRDVQVVSVHLHWPFPFGQQDQARAIIKDLEPLQGGVTILGGDFNMVASGRSVAWIESAAQARRVGPWVRSFDLFGYPLGIDHVLASGGTGTLSVRPKLGSDHFGLLASVAFP